MLVCNVTYGLETAGRNADESKSLNQFSFAASKGTEPQSTYSKIAGLPESTTVPALPDLYNAGTTPPVSDIPYLRRGR